MGKITNLLALIGLFACGPGATIGRTETKPLPPKTTANLAGLTCQGASCSCADSDKIGLPEAGFKRFQVILGSSPNELGLWLGGQTFRKPADPLRYCFYVDLPKGKHKLTLVTPEVNSGVAAGVTINEASAYGYYATFRFQCGAPGVCHANAIDRFAARVSGYARNLHDPCGSTKVKGVKWDTRRVPGSKNLEYVMLEATLEIYDFVPSKPSCPADEE